MKIVVFGEEQRIGLLSGDKILDVAAAHARSTKPSSIEAAAFARLVALIEAGPPALDRIAELEAEAQGSDAAGLWHDASTAQLHAPWAGKRIFMAGSNHAGHVSSFFTSFGQPRTPEEAYEMGRRGPPSGFWAVPDPLGPGADLPMPARANGLLDYEVEPAIVIGRKTKRIKNEDYRSYVWGVTIVADWSVRPGVWPMTPPAPYILDKNFDGSKSIGPCILVGDIDPEALDLTTRVNGELRQSFNSSEMIFGFGEVLEHMSLDLTFGPGDVIALGTGTGTAIDQTKVTDPANWPRDLYLKPGDVVEMASPQIGSFETRIVAGD